MRITFEFDTSEMTGDVCTGKDNEALAKVMMQSEEMYSALQEIRSGLYYKLKYLGPGETIRHNDGFEHKDVLITEHHLEGIEIALAYVQRTLEDSGVSLDLLT